MKYLMNNKIIIYLSSICPKIQAFIHKSVTIQSVILQIYSWNNLTKKHLYGFFSSIQAGSLYTERNTILPFTLLSYGALLVAWAENIVFWWPSSSLRDFKLKHQILPFL